MSDDRAPGDGSKQTDAAPRRDVETATLSPYSPLSPHESAPPAPELPANAFEGYEILREIHRGGQGVVYQAIQLSTRRKVALKVLKEGALAGPMDRARFEREIQVLAQLRHPNIVTIHDSGVSNGRWFYVMEYVRGERLDAWVTEHKPPSDEILRLLKIICEAVGHAQRHGVIHRDLKPANILVDHEGAPHVLDFGLAKVAAGSIIETQTPLTISREFIGTLPYASPEQTLGDPSLIDMRGDVYALGVILYQLLTGAFPYPVVGDLKTVLRHIAETPPRRPSAVNAGLPRDIDAILLTALSKDRASRYQTATELAEDIDRYLCGQPLRARRASLSYVTRIRAREMVRRYRMGTSLLVLIASVLLGYMAAYALLRVRPSLIARYERWVCGGLVGIGGPVDLSSVRVVALRDDTEVEALASALGVDGVRADDWTSVRRLHGKLMEKLAASGARAVVWDIMFPSATEHDPYFVRGVEALGRAGVPVVVAVAPWWFDGAPRLSPAIAPVVQWGGAIVDFDGDSPWKVELAAARVATEPLAGLSLAAAAAFRQPDAEYSVGLDTSRERLRVRYFRSDPQLPRARQWLDVFDEAALTAVAPARDMRNVEHGLQPDDLVAYLVVHLPDDATLSARTLDYQSMMSADEAELRKRVEGTLVMIGDFRSDRPAGDFFAHHDGRTLHGCYGHAAALDLLLHNRSVRSPAAGAQWLLAALAAAAGVWSGRRCASRPLFCVLAGACGVAAIFAVGWPAIRFFGYLWSPWVAAAAFAIALFPAAWTRRVQSAHAI